MLRLITQSDLISEHDSLYKAKPKVKAYIPVVDLSTSRSMRVKRRLVHVLRFVEAEPVVSAVPGTVQLLQKKNDSIVDDTKHPKSVHSWQNHEAKQKRDKKKKNNYVTGDYYKHNTDLNNM